MLQINEMDGAVILTLSDTLSPREQNLLAQAREILRENSEPKKPKSWADIFREKNAAGGQSANTPRKASAPKAYQGGNADSGIEELNRVLNSGMTEDAMNAALDDMGFEVLFDPDDERVPF